MHKFYANVETEILDFIHHCHNLTNTMNISPVQSSIPCLTIASFDTFSLAIEHLNVFTNFLSSYTSDMSIEYDQIISIVSHCSDLVYCVNNYQCLFVEYAIDDYLYLDEQFDLIYEKTLEILRHIHNLTTINAEIYFLEQKLQCYLPSDYLNHITSSLSNRIAATLIDQTSQLFLSSYSSLSNNHDEDNNECAIASSLLFSTSPISINIDSSNATNNSNDNTTDYSDSLLQLDKINIHTTILRQSRFVPSFQFDFNDFDQIENHLKNFHSKNIWMKIEREFFMNIISILSNQNLSTQTINPWSSEIFWALTMHFKYADISFKSEFFLIIQWCLCLLTIQAYNRDWDLLLSKTVVNTIMTNRWAIVSVSEHIHLSIVGQCLNQMFLRLIRITSVLQFMKILCEQSSCLNTFLPNITSSSINHLTKQIEGTFHLLIIWLNQHANAFINGNALERTLVICKSDQIQLSITINNLLEVLKQLENCEKTINLVEHLNSSCEIIVNETMSKLYQRIQINTTKHFDSQLPLKTNDLCTISQDRSYMIIACDKILKPVLTQCECLNIDKKFDIYEQIFSSFIQAWTSVLRNRKYCFSDEIRSFLQKDYEYLQTFLSMNISDDDIVQFLNKSSSIQEISFIIDVLRKGEKHGSESSISNIPNHDKWFSSRKSSSSLLQCVQYLCCCQRRNRVMTGYS
ncbi:unnamed protein product [Rotaria magnacalcarata]|uniref:Uncharacterized protein n=3 Tax=Rotaria magnacalcarata TaxID=392030 RepID=A0A816NMW8_9BILA|nr:unnamed protein product [Rotaria magnacalcarata]CAF1401355.1 unnamed protein product [Rotaria magnacalcarata]CAF2037058.1 unnamed protein product [Rotaria magnacalcarata]CAF2096716.1 unnamed protein product [Rotaria magnacalcarata]